jgi:hypothetical protein
MNKRLLMLLNGRPELLKYVKQSRNMERKKMAWNLIVNQKKYATMDLDWYKSKEAYAILSKVLMKLVNEQLGGLPGLFSRDSSKKAEKRTEELKSKFGQYLKSDASRQQEAKELLERIQTEVDIENSIKTRKQFQQAEEMGHLQGRLTNLKKPS